MNVEGEQKPTEGQRKNLVGAVRDIVTIPLIFETVSYDEVKSNLQKVIDSELFN